MSPNKCQHYTVYAKVGQLKVNNKKIMYHLFIKLSDMFDQNPGVTLTQLVKASVGQADVQRFEPHLDHNLLSCGVFLVKSRHFGLPLAQTIMTKLAISLSGWLGRYTNVEYLQSLYLKRRGQLLLQV